MTPGDRFAAVLDLFSFALQQQRANLRRRFPKAQEANIDAKLAKWLAKRPGAENADAVVSGHPSFDRA